MVAVDPALIGHGRLIYLWPNPFAWAGPFLAADTGGAIQQRRIDFYDWRGRRTQRAWGRRATTLTLSPHDAADPPGNPAAAIATVDCSDTDADTNSAARPGAWRRVRAGRRCRIRRGSCGAAGRPSSTAPGSGGPRGLRLLIPGAGPGTRGSRAARLRRARSPTAALWCTDAEGRRTPERWGPHSTIRPSYITAIPLHEYWTVLRSWEMNT
jgi:hypothetical protein